jgi:hypothetical protein
MENKEIILPSGKKCTCSGEWELKGYVTTTIFLSKGEIIPEYCGKKVQWILIKKG